MSLRYLTAGESHGQALVGILDGLPSGLSIVHEDIQAHLSRRKLGFGRGARQKIETDEVQIISGVRRGKTLGSPMSLIIQNKDWVSWQTVMQVEPDSDSDPSSDRKREVFVPRPGHADLVGGVKYDHADLRNVLERSSARETAMRVALGSVALRFLRELGIFVGSRVVEVGGRVDPSVVVGSVHELNARVDLSPVRCLGGGAEKEMIEAIESAHKAGDTLGGVFEVIASGVPVGLGSYSQWDRRLEAQIGEAFLSLNAIKGVEVGLGWGASQKRGSEVHDEIILGEELPGASDSTRTQRTVTFQTNRSGGIDGGMSTGQNLVIRAAMKPLSTLMKPLASVHLKTGAATPAHIERSDVCAVPSAAVIGEAILGLVLSQKILEKFGGDSLREVAQRVTDWRRSAPIHFPTG